MYATDTTDGMVVTSGDGATHAVPIRNGRAVREAISSSYVGGDDLTSYMHSRLFEKGLLGDSPSDKETARLIKENACYVALNFRQESKKAEKTPEKIAKEFKLDDGRVIKLGDEMFKCPEALFEPSTIGKDDDVGVPGLVFNR